MTHLVAIHQPNFFPWLGYFDKINRSDCFVFLDDVQIQKTGSSWTNRVKMIVSGNQKWVTIPIERNYHGVRKICETQFKTHSDWRNEILRTLQVSYKKAPHYKYTIDLIEPLLTNPENNLATYNSSAIIAIAEELGINSSRFRWSSRLEHVGRSNELLVSIVKNVGGRDYLCGGGADGYQDKDVFDAASIALVRQDYVPLAYSQFGSSFFTPGLSIIDVLMNIGREGAINMLCSSSMGIRN